MLIKAYITILFLIVLILGVCMYKAGRLKGTLAKKMSALQLCAMIAILANVVFVASDREKISNIGFSVFSAMIDWILIAMDLFIQEYVSTGNGTARTREPSAPAEGTAGAAPRGLFMRPAKDVHFYVIRAAVFLAVADTVSLLANVFFGHVFQLESKRFLLKYVIYEAASFTPVYHAHLVLCYLFVIRIGMLLIGRAVKSSYFYRSKFLVVLFLFAVLLVLDALCVIFHVPLNVSIIFYGGLALAIFYYTFYYEPKSLLNGVLQMIMKNINNGIVCFDDRQNCIYANDVVWDMFHIKKDIHVLEEFTYAGQREKYSLEEPYSVWHETREIDGGMRYYEFERQNIYDKKGMFVGSYFNMKDQTELQRLHEKEINMEKEANRAKSDFLSRVSHDIRTPINSISGMNEMILRENKDSTIQEYAGYIQEAVEVLSGLINDVLDFSKIEAGKMTVVDREYSTASLLNSVIDMIRIQSEKKGLDFVCSISEKLPSALLGDDVKLRQIILNLLSNAVKYTQDGRVMFHVWEETDDAGGFFMNVEVKDTGIGIKEEDLPKIFSAFERFEEAKNHSIQGTGLGLNITAHFIKMMGSELKVKSVYGLGSSFSFRVRQEVADPAPVLMGGMADRAARPRRTVFQKPDARILVVDDNLINRKVFMQLLKETKIRIDDAESGALCLDLISKNHYDLIFLDHMMPEMDGIETFEEMKKMENNKCLETPVVMLTANAMDGAREKYLGLGFRDFITKPVNPAALEELVEKYLG